MFAEVSKESLQQKAVIKSFSQGWVFPRVSLTFYYSMIYTNDLDLFKAHFLKQLQCACATIKEDHFRMNVLMTSSTLTISDAKRVIDEVVEGRVEINEVTMYLFENSLHESRS